MRGEHEKEEERGGDLCMLHNEEEQSRLIRHISEPACTCEPG